jgi:hypothetical protein
MSDGDDGDGATGDEVDDDGDRSRCCVAPPDGKRGCGTGDLRDNGGSDDNSPSSSSSYKDNDATYAGAALGEERGAIRTD